MKTHFEDQLSWTRRHMPRLRRSLSYLPDLSGMRLACSMHIDLKIIPLIEGILARNAQVFLTTCNPTTVRDEVVNYLHGQGVDVQAWLNMPLESLSKAFSAALDWMPTHLCEFGADLTATYIQREQAHPTIKASLEGTSSGIIRLRRLSLPYPVFNWNDLPIKEDLHNRHMVGLTTWLMFYNRTQLSLHGKHVLIIGYGSVGQGVALAARSFGGSVTIVERNPGRALQATFDGWPVRSLEESLPFSDVVVTATGSPKVLDSSQFSILRDGAFLLNIGHQPDEINVPSLRVYPHKQVLPYVEEFNLRGRLIYLIAGGSMANLTAGPGDSLNAFDVTLAVLASGISYINGPGDEWTPGLHLLPNQAWENCLNE
ncbi:MAG: adenosylhomocysteinase [Anaerolineales bacterium]|nr:adenosylhomocysteinase [Anaerolineales bacterium]